MFGYYTRSRDKGLYVCDGFYRGGNLRNFLKSNFSKLSWLDKLNNLFIITGGLCNIHDENLIHRDFHIGNILSLDNEQCLITDLGLSKPADETVILKIVNKRFLE